MRSLSLEFQNVPNPEGLARRISKLVSELDECTYQAFQELWVKRRINRFSLKSLVAPGEQLLARRIYLLAEEAHSSSDMLPDQVSGHDSTNSDLASIVSAIKMGRKGGIQKGLRQLLYTPGKTAKDPKEAWRSDISHQWRPEFIGYEIGFRSITLDFYFGPSPEHAGQVFAATTGNMNRLSHYRETFQAGLQRSSLCGGYGAARYEQTWELLCLSCWSDRVVDEETPFGLVRFGLPIRP